MQIFIQVLSGKVVSLNLEEDSLVSMVKMKILDLEGIPFEMQRLIYCSKELSNHQRLCEYQICQHSTLQVGLKIISKCNIRVQLAIGDELLIEIIPEKNVFDLKSLIEQRYGIPKQMQQLTFNQNFLENEKTLSFYGIIHSSIINLDSTVKSINRVQIQVIQENGYSFQEEDYEQTQRNIVEIYLKDVDSYQRTQVLELMEKINIELEIPVEEQELFIQTKKLDKNFFLDDYFVNSTTIIKVKHRKILERHTLTVQTYDGRTYILKNIHEQHLVFQLKQKIPFDVHKQVFTFVDGTVLSNKHPIKWYKILQTKEKKIRLTFQWSHKLMKINTDSGIHVEVLVNSDHSYENLMFQFIAVNPQVKKDSLVNTFGQFRIIRNFQVEQNLNLRLGNISLYHDEILSICSRYVQMEFRVCDGSSKNQIVMISPINSTFVEIKKQLQKILKLKHREVLEIIYQGHVVKNMQSPKDYKMIQLEFSSLFSAKNMMLLYVKNFELGLNFDFEQRETILNADDVIELN